MKNYQIFLLLLTISTTSWAGPREIAYKLHNRIAGIPPVKSEMGDPLSEMEALVAAGRPEEAAKIAIENPHFYNIVLKNWIKPWSNREESPRVPLNDYVATVIGIIRDNKPFTEVLTGDILYTVDYVATGNNVYDIGRNDHYSSAENNRLDLKETLIENRQSTLTGLPSNAVAGVITSRGAGEAFYSAGTNRRVNRYTFMNYLCKDYEELHDVNVPDFRVRRDVERDPGGDSRAYKNQCVGCHAGQDALGGAFAHYDFTGNRLVYTPSTIVRKMNHNVYYKDGFVTENDSWINLWANGTNAKLGWRGATSGRGVQELNAMFARSRAFSQCMAKKAFQLVCLKPAVNTGDLKLVEELADKFEKTNYNMKQLIVNASVGCIINENK